MNHNRSRLEEFLGSCTKTDLLHAFFSNWLNELLPGIYHLVGCEQGKENHCEGDVAVHTAMVFETLLRVCRDDLGREADFVERLFALIHDWKKPDTRRVTPAGVVSFPGHEELAAAEVDTIANKLDISNVEMKKLFFLVSEHGNAHNFNELSKEKRQEIQGSPFLESLCLAQKADAMSCLCTSGGHLPVYWNLLLQRLDTEQSLNNE